MTTLKNREKGFALVLAVVVVTLLAVAGLELSREVRLSVALASNFQDRTKARLKALDGLTLAARTLLDDDPTHDSLDEDWASLGQKLNRPADDQDQAPEKTDPGELNLELGDLGGLLNLNLLIDQKGQANALWVGVFQRLLEVTGQDPDLLPALQDWLDPDDRVRSGGAEAPEYESLGRKFGPRNGPLLDMGELGLVKGFDKKVLEGEEDVAGLAGLVTVSGATKINVNTAPVELLQALDSGLREGLATAITELRSERPIRRLVELRGLVGMSPDLFRAVVPLLDVKSDWFAADSRGRWGRSEYRIRAVLQRNRNEVKVIKAELG